MDTPLLEESAFKWTWRAHDADRDRVIAIWPAQPVYPKRHTGTP